MVIVSFFSQFLFPPHLQKPRSTGRLYIFAKYGPLQSNGKLSGGYRRERPMTDSELNVLIENIEEEDELRVSLVCSFVET